MVMRSCYTRLWMTHIAIDCRFSSTQSGIGSYTRGLVTALVEHFPAHRFTLFVQNDSEEWLQKFLGIPSIVIVRAPHHPYTALGFLELIPHLFVTRPELFFAPHFALPLLTFSGRTIAVIHDLILHRYPGEASLVKKFFYRVVMALTVVRASKVLTISSAVASDLIKAYPRIKQKLDVVHPGIHPRFSPCSEERVLDVRARYGIPQKYFLSVGHDKPHKNIPLLCKSFSESNSVASLVLVCPSAGAERYTADKIRVLQSVSDDDLPALYSGALASVTATKEEGFYLPALEAMACACPVLATNVGPIPEVTGGFALLVNPDEVSLRSGFESILGSSWQGRTHREEAQKYAMNFTWQRSAVEIGKLLDL